MSVEIYANIKLTNGDVLENATFDSVGLLNIAETVEEIEVYDSTDCYTYSFSDINDVYDIIQAMELIDKHGESIVLYSQNHHLNIDSDTESDFIRDYVTSTHSITDWLNDYIHNTISVEFLNPIGGFHALDLEYIEQHVFIYEGTYYYLDGDYYHIFTN